MYYNEIFDKYKLDENKLTDYGFKFKDNKYIYIKDINDCLFAKFIITDNTFYVKVCDEEDEEYLPFTMKVNEGGYISSVREKVESIKQDILTNCFIRNNIRDHLLDYVFHKYHTTPEYPWKDSPLYCTLKTNDKKKWYGLIMNIPYKTLGLKSEGMIDVINLKNDPEKIANLIDNKHYFKAYHMNKKYWLTILLDNKVELDEVKNLLDESYQVVENK